MHLQLTLHTMFNKHLFTIKSSTYILYWNLNNGKQIYLIKWHLNFRTLNKLLHCQAYLHSCLYSINFLYLKLSLYFLPKQNHQSYQKIPFISLKIAYKFTVMSFLTVLISLTYFHLNCSFFVFQYVIKYLYQNCIKNKPDNQTHYECR